MTVKSELRKILPEELRFDMVEQILEPGQAGLSRAIAIHSFVDTESNILTIRKSLYPRVCMPPMFVLRGEGISKEEAIESLKTKYMKVICDVLDKTMFISGRLKDVKLSQFVKSDLGSIYSMSILFTNHTITLVACFLFVRMM